jgi:hypothetical protein
MAINPTSSSTGNPYTYDSTGGVATTDPFLRLAAMQIESAADEQKLNDEIERAEREAAKEATERAADALDKKADKITVGAAVSLGLSTVGGALKSFGAVTDETPVADSKTPPTPEGSAAAAGQLAPTSGNATSIPTAATPNGAAASPGAGNTGDTTKAPNVPPNSSPTKPAAGAPPKPDAPPAKSNTLSDLLKIGGETAAKASDPTYKLMGEAPATRQDGVSLRARHEADGHQGALEDSRRRQNRLDDHVDKQLTTVEKILELQNQTVTHILGKM